MRFLVILLLAFCFGMPAHAQTEDLLQNDNLTLILSPEYPRPESTLTITPRSYLVDLATAHVSVYINDELVAENTGEVPVTVQTGAPGSQLSIRVVAIADGTSYETSMIVYPQGTALIVEPQVTMPPLYRGAGKLPATAITRIVAVPDFRSPTGTLINPSTLSYSWYAEDTLLKEQSGLGRSVLLIEGPQRYRPTEVSVIVTSREQPYVTSALVTLDPIDPFVRVYPSDPLTGPWFSRSVPETYTMKKEEETFVAAPYFFTAQPQLSWRVGGTEQGTLDTLTVRTGGTGEGTATLSLRAVGKDVFSLATFTSEVSFGKRQVTQPLFGI